MSAPVRYDELHRSEHFLLYDILCNGQDSPGEEEVTELKIVLCRRGLFVHETGGESTVCEPGRAVLIHPEEPFRTRHPLGCADRTTSVGLSAEFLEQARRHHAPRRSSWRRTVVLAPRAALFGRWIHDRASRGRQPEHARVRDPLAIEEALNLLVEQVLTQASGVDPWSSPALLSPSNRRAAMATLELLHQRYREALPLAEIAAEVGLSPYHLCRVYRAHFGRSIQATRNSLRLEEAAEALLDGAADLTQLAHSLGYGTHSHFTASFRRAFGVTPSGFRNQSLATWRRTGQRRAESL